MRSLQKQYFEAKKKGLYDAANKILPHAKDAESRVDRMIAEEQGAIPKNQISLFGDTPLQHHRV